MEHKTELVDPEADITVKIMPKPGSRLLRVRVEYKADIVDSVVVSQRRVDPPDARRP